jgi:hypothetical protein
MSTPRSIPHLSPRRKVAGGLVAGALVLAVPSVAGANVRTTVSSIKAAGTASVSTIAPLCESAITARQTQIDQLDNHIAVAPNLAPAHATTLKSDLSAAASGLTTLNGQIEAATTVKDLVPLCRQIVNNFRIYVLRTPQTHLTIGADQETAVIARLDGVSPKLQAAITTAQGKGKDVGQAPTLYADFTSKLADATTKTNGASDQVLALTVDQYNSGSAKPVLQTTYQNLTLARGDLIAARQDAQQIVQILKSA